MLGNCETQTKDNHCPISLQKKLYRTLCHIKQHVKHHPSPYPSTGRPELRLAVAVANPPPPSSYELTLPSAEGLLSSTQSATLSSPSTTGTLLKASATLTFTLVSTALFTPYATA